MSMTTSPRASHQRPTARSRQESAQRLRRCLADVERHLQAVQLATSALHAALESAFAEFGEPSETDPEKHRRENAQGGLAEILKKLDVPPDKRRTRRPTPAVDTKYQ